MIRMFFVSIIVCFVASCAPIVTSENAGDHESAIEVRLVEVGKDDPMPFANLLDHPYEFYPRELTQLARTLEYSVPGVIGWDPAQPVFAEAIIAKLVPLMKNKLEEASALQKIAFAVTSSRGTTTGDVFVMAGKLHWRIEVLQGVDHFDAYVSPFEFESETEIKPNWILHLNEHQAYGDHESFLGMRQDVKNWIAMHIGTTGTAKNATHDIVPTGFSDRLGNIEELFNTGLISEAEYHDKTHQLLSEAEAANISPHGHLRLLRELHESGLITDEELARKRQDILDRL